MATSEVNFFKKNSKNQNTTQATNSWYKNYLRWADKKGVRRDIENVEKTELNGILEIYFAESIRVDGKQYEPSSLANMQAGIDRYLKENGYECSINKDIAFEGSRDVLEGRAKYLREELGMGNKPNAADSFSPGEEEQLWESGQLGAHNAHALVATMHMNLTQHLGLRGRQEHHSMKMTDFKFDVDEFGTRFVTFSESLTKTRGKALHKKLRKEIPKMFETRVPGKQIALCTKCTLLIRSEFLRCQSQHANKSRLKI